MKSKYYILILGTFLLAACSSNHSDGTLGITGGSWLSSSQEETMEELAAPGLQEENNQVSEDEPQPQVIQLDKIIKTADIKFEVSDYQKSKRTIDSLVQAWGGFISNENEYSYNYRIVNNIVIRISNQNFEKLIDDIGETSARIDHKRINSIDVSEEYIDIEARLKTKKEVERRYQALLKKASKVEDILRIENEIRKIQEEIEAKEGRLRYLQSRISFSTINLEVYQKLEYRYKPDNETNFFSRLHKALDKGWKGLISFIIGLLHIWPLLLAVGAGLVIYFKFKKKAKA